MPPFPEPRASDPVTPTPTPAPRFGDQQQNHPGSTEEIPAPDHGEARRKAKPVLSDIRDEADCVALVDKAVSELGRVDILVNNAAYQMSQPDGIETITTEQFDRVMCGMFARPWAYRYRGVPAGR